MRGRLQAGAVFVLLAAVLAGWWWLARPAGPQAVSVNATAQHPSPALWRLSKDGRGLFLFGTFHAVPTGAKWLSPAIAAALDEADVLILEVTGLEAERRDNRVFETLARSPGLPPLIKRLDEKRRRELATLTQDQPMLAHGLDGYESWAAALLIGARADKGEDVKLSTAAAPEEVLAREMRVRGRSVQGLETIKGQLGLFDAMPEPLQRRLLANALDEAADSATLFAQFYAAWARGDQSALERFYNESFAGESELRRIMVEDRNSRWVRQIVTYMDEQEESAPFIAVGAGHLLGSGSLQALLAKEGWRVERIR